MADAPSIFLAFTVTVIPFFIGVALHKLEAFRRHPQAMLALALGMAFYFLFDSFLDSTELGVTLGVSGGLQSVLLLASFSLAFIVLVFSRNGPDYSWPIWAVAIGISIHSFSEANELASAAQLYLSNFSSVLPDASSFVIHKFLEGFVFSSAATLASTSFRRAVSRATPMIFLAGAGSLSSYLPLDLTPFVAAGAGGWMAVTISLAPQFRVGNRPVFYLLILVGFIIVYSASLLHFTAYVAG